MTYAALNDHDAYARVSISRRANGDITVAITAGKTSSDGRQAVLTPSDWPRLAEIIDSLAAEMLEGGTIGECRWQPVCDGYGQPPRPETQRVNNQAVPTHTLKPSAKDSDAPGKLF